jgi:hypothetical protein
MASSGAATFLRVPSCAATVKKKRYPRRIVARVRVVFIMVSVWPLKLLISGFSFFCECGQKIFTASTRGSDTTTIGSKISRGKVTPEEPENDARACY